MKAFGQVEQVGDHDDPNAGAGEREEDLAADVGAFALVGGGERLIAQQQAPGRTRETVTLIRASSSSNLPPVMAGPSSRLKWVKTRGQTPAAKEPGGHGHAGLHHELGQARTAQERGLASPVGPCHHDQRLAVGAHVVAHSAPVRDRG